MKMPFFIVGFLSAALLTATALGDGKIVSTAIAQPQIPDQRALIHWADGVQTLVIDTHFTGEGERFAWIVPTPAVPEVEVATPGLFPTLQSVFAPRIIVEDDVPPVAGVAALILLLAGPVWFVRVRVAAGESRVLGVLAIAAAFVVAVGALLPSLGAARRGPAGGSEVNVLNRQMIDRYEIATLAATEGDALVRWLRENGFHVSPGVLAGIDAYIRDGWVFTAVKLADDDGEFDTRKSPPLSLRFAAGQPVYPLRLTGIANGPLDVELYVFGPGRAAAKHFTVTHCEKPSYPPHDPESGRYKSESLEVLHPDLRQRVHEAQVATVLRATLTPEQMARDATIEWHPFRAAVTRKYSGGAASAIAANTAISLLLIGCVGVTVVGRRRKWSRRRLGSAMAAGLVSVAAIGLSTWLALPKIQVTRVVGPDIRNSVEHRSIHVEFYFAVKTGPPAMPLQAWARNVLDRPAGEHDRPGRLRNLITGGTIRFEDSPGNFILMDTEKGLVYRWFDRRGAPHDLPLY